MKNNRLTAINTLLLFIPWTILPLRGFEWALKSPTAEIMIFCYAAFMIFSGIFTMICYNGKGLRSNLMKLCVVINSMYAIGGLTALCMMFLPRIM